MSSSLNSSIILRLVLNKAKDRYSNSYLDRDISNLESPESYSIGSISVSVSASISASILVLREGKIFRDTSVAVSVAVSVAASKAVAGVVTVAVAVAVAVA